jgi:twinfilin
MVYSSGCYAFFLQIKSLFSSSSSVLFNKRIETSDPKEIDESYLLDRLGSNDEGSGGDGGSSSVRQKIGAWEQREQKPFARPKGPSRR